MRRQAWHAGSLGREELQHVVSNVRLHTWSRMLGHLYYRLRRHTAQEQPGEWLRTNCVARLQEIRELRARARAHAHA